MSLKAETFYAIRCDFPDCGDLFERGEFTYWCDPYHERATAEEDGWYVGEGDRCGEDYCSEHVINDPCDGCKDCDYDYSFHRRPMPDTWENRLKVALDRIFDRADRELDRLEERTFARIDRMERVTDGELVKIFDRTCLAFDPTLSGQDLFGMRRSTSYRRGQ